MPEPFNFLGDTPLPKALAELLQSEEQLRGFIRMAGSTMAGFREMPDSAMYEGTLHDIMYKMGVDESKLPQDVKVWQNLAYRFQSYARILIDVKDREGVSSTLPPAIYNKFDSGEKPMPEEGTLDRLQFDVAKIFAEKRDATDAEKAVALAGLIELPKQFVEIGFCGFGCATLAASNPEMAMRALWQINAILTASKLITEPSRPAETASAAPKIEKTAG